MYVVEVYVVDVDEEEEGKETVGITPFGGYALTLTQYVGPRTPGDFAPSRKPMDRGMVGTSLVSDCTLP